MKKIFRVVALCVVIGCAGSVKGAGAEHCMQQDAGRYPQQGDGTAMWAAAAPKPEDDSGLTWQQVMGIVMLCGGCCGGGVLWQKARQVRIEPQPLEVQMSKDYVTRSEFEDYRKQVASDIDRIHQRLDKVMPAVAEIKGELKQIAQKQAQILNLLLNGKASE